MRLPERKHLAVADKLGDARLLYRAVYCSRGKHRQSLEMLKEVKEIKQTIKEVCK